MEAFGHQRVGKTKHHGGIGIGPRRQPFGVGEPSNVFTHWADVDKRHTLVVTGLEPLRRPMPPHPTAIDLRVLQRNTTESNHEVSVFGNH